MDFNSQSSDPERSRSYQNLENARENASKTKGYNSEQTRNALKDSFRERFGYDPHFWQLDITEAMLLGLDCIVIAGTGAGKTAPFMMLVLPDPKKKTLILSPLKVLQEDQVSRFWAAKLPAAAVNGDTWDGDLKQDLEADIYQGIFASSEMCLKHPEFHRVLSDSNFEDMVGWIVDEAHCIGQWGGDFRPTYSELGKLRAFFPPDVPVLTASATTTPLTLRDIRTTLGIDPQTSFFLNLGND
ncbi:P-loop containing nucleoside triphosphate hydrolase protein [Pholiota conissans]|uniref:P-loop containing nucleoside triphosphate hydrolase protein n=1 Tax=Pholiota conissans TaxID=109636 RepID=A0A9P6CSR8_9AGAR|nr:P-loop containing nucleoside triphosphate hydrolase protein [Pholiota conissans]